MEHVILVIHLIVTLVMIVLILLQRSEGGGLGLGTGGGLGNFASAQSTGNALTKATTYLAITFFITSIILAVSASNGGASKSILDVAAPAAKTSTAAPAVPVAADAAPEAVSTKNDAKAETKSVTGKDAPPVPIAK